MRSLPGSEWIDEGRGCCRAMLQRGCIINICRDAPCMRSTRPGFTASGGALKTGNGRVIPVCPIRVQRDRIQCVRSGTGNGRRQSIVCGEVLLHRGFFKSALALFIKCISPSSRTASARRGISDARYESTHRPAGGWFSRKGTPHRTPSRRNARLRDSSSHLIRE